jgi:large subunit ribosomal protein L24
MRIKTGDTVLIITGDDRGRTAKVLKVSPKGGRIQIEGINIQKKHHRPRKEGEKGQIIEKPGFISISNVKLVCPKCSKPTRVGYKVKSKVVSAQGGKGSGKSKIRICKKCQAVI